MAKKQKSKKNLNSHPQTRDFIYFEVLTSHEQVTNKLLCLVQCYCFLKRKTIIKVFQYKSYIKFYCTTNYFLSACTHTLLLLLLLLISHHSFLNNNNNNNRLIDQLNSNEPMISMNQCETNGDVDPPSGIEAQLLSI
jgi:hypothetical protein